tara:strand:- start:489 stop:896 length:408 start_codon:yes stop_codon:yes gene_type:complete
MQNQNFQFKEDPQNRENRRIQGYHDELRSLAESYSQGGMSEGEYREKLKQSGDRWNSKNGVWQQTIYKPKPLAGIYQNFYNTPKDHFTYKYPQGSKYNKEAGKWEANVNNRKPSGAWKVSNQNQEPTVQTPQFDF